MSWTETILGVLSIAMYGFVWWSVSTCSKVIDERNAQIAALKALIGHPSGKVVKFDGKLPMRLLAAYVMYPGETLKFVATDGTEVFITSSASTTLEISA